MAVSDETFYPQRHEDEHVRLNVPDLRSSAAAARGPAAAAVAVSADRERIFGANCFDFSSETDSPQRVNNARRTVHPMAVSPSGQTVHSEAVSQVKRR